MTVVFTVSAGGSTLDNEDRRAAVLTVQRYNELQGASLPTDTNANIRASYLTVITAYANEWHAGNVNAAKSSAAAIKAGLTEAQQAEILGAVVDRLIVNKDTYTTILNDIITP